MNSLCSRETTGQKYCMSKKKLEQKTFQIMAFAAKLEQRRLKYRSSKRADLGICSWDASWCRLNVILCYFLMPKVIIEPNRIEL